MLHIYLNFVFIGDKKESYQRSDVTGAERERRESKMN